MQELAHSGAVSIAYGHFYIAEWVEVPDFRTDDPVIVTPGQFTIISRVQAHLIEVTLQLAAVEPAPGTGWQLLGSYPYRPTRAGLIAVTAPTTGQGPQLQLHPHTTYTAYIFTHGRADSRERWQAAMAREEWGAGLDGGFEAYLVTFVPTGSQQAPPPPEGRPVAVDEEGQLPAN
ncbi:hypothetical protein ACIHCM_37270 [Streptomyces sp. NPDC052023]|uniref:hypothetical protein n=1 Tax=Streptomyces sp. NPDC052023 TaxID=3365681 RepID=UPI0037D6A4D9